MKMNYLKQLMKMPWFILGCLSLAFCFAARNVFDVSGLIHPYQQSIWTIILLQASRIAPLVIILWVYHRDACASKRFIPILCSHPLRLLGIAFLESLGLGFLLFSDQVTSIFSIGLPIDHMFFGIGNSLLLIATAEFFLKHERATALMGLAVSIVFAAVIEFALAIMQTEISTTIQIVLPFVSCIFLIEAQRRSRARKAPSIHTGAKKVYSTPSRKDLLLLLVFIFCYAFIFNSLKSTWIIEPLSMENTFLAIKYSSTFGLLLSGLLIYAFIDVNEHERRSIPLTSVLVPLIMISLYVSTFLGSELSFIYVATLFIARKLLFFLIWNTALLFNKRRMRMRMFTMGILALEMGFLAYYSLHELFLLAVLSETIAMSMIIVILLVSMLSYELISWIIKEREKNENASTGTVDAIQKVEKDYGLTDREKDVFAFLASGRNADYIAKKLIIAPTTAKSHISHIYQKMNINSQQQLLDIVEEVQAELGNEKL